ncbi:hypothetical protein D918_04105 [Trichuris suis]|nr:hypothetical protein D918_04105 [Trichuris suis]
MAWLVRPACMAGSQNIRLVLEPESFMLEIKLGVKWIRLDVHRNEERILVYPKLQSWQQGYFFQHVKTAQTIKVRGTIRGVASPTSPRLNSRLRGRKRAKSEVKIY